MRQLGIRVLRRDGLLHQRPAAAFQRGRLRRVGLPEPSQPRLREQMEA